MVAQAVATLVCCVMAGFCWPLVLLMEAVDFQRGGGGAVDVGTWRTGALQSKRTTNGVYDEDGNGQMENSR